MRQGQPRGVKLSGQNYQEDNNIPIGVGLDGMVKLNELTLTYRHARKSESC